MLTGFDLVRAVYDVPGLNEHERAVLVYLAYKANDKAQAYPGIALIVEKTGASERTVQRAIKSLAAAGHITQRQRRHDSALYTIHPITAQAEKIDIKPVRETGVRETGVTQSPKPARVTPKQPISTISSEAKASSDARACRPDPFPRPAFADPQHWADFLTNRKQKRCPNTATAHKKLMDDIARLADDEWPPGRMIEHAAARGWAGIYDPRERENRNGRSSSNSTARRSSPVDAIASAGSRIVDPGQPI